MLIIPDGDRRYARREYLAGLFNESLKAFRETLSALSKRDAELLEERIEEYNQTGRDPFYDDRENFMDILYSGKIFVPQGYLLNSYKKGGEVFSSLMKCILQNDITKVLSIYALQRRNLERPDEQVEIMLKVEAEIFKLWADNKEMMSSCKVKFVGNQKIFDLYKDKKILRGAIDYYVNSIKLLETKSSGKKLKVYVLAPYDRVWEINQAIVSGRFNPARLVVKEEVDLIIVNTPNYLHFEMTKAALMAGKHVVVEKPITVTSKECEELIKIAKKKKLVLAPYHNRRFDGGFKTVKKLLSENRLGTLKKCRITMHRYRPEIGPKIWKEEDFPGAGLLYDLGSHLIDQCLDLFGWPLAVDADLQIQRKNSKVIDFFCITLKYETFNAEIVSDMLTKDTKPAYWMTGTKASFVKYGIDPQEERLGERVTSWEKLGKDPEENYGTLINNDAGNTERIRTQVGDYGQFYQNVFEVIRKDAPLFITPAQALNVIKLIEWVKDFSVTIKTVNNS